MKIVNMLILSLIMSISFVHAQDETMYLMKEGLVIANYKLAEIDSVIFYMPAMPDVTDYNGNVYKTVQIGMQVWMAENLRTTHYTDGTLIELVSGDSNWAGLTAYQKAYCWYNDDSTSYAQIYGALYTWSAAMNGEPGSNDTPSGVQGICPTGWHLPSDAEWQNMEYFLSENGYNYDGTTGGVREKIAKSMASTTGWNLSTGSGDVGNTDYPEYRNKSGFTALPGGSRNPYQGYSINIGRIGYYWSASVFIADAWHRMLSYDGGNVSRSYFLTRAGYSVRCVRN